MAILNLLYLVSCGLIAIYGFHSLTLTVMYYWQNRRHATAFPSSEADWPTVTIQLPIYNEQYVVERLLAACVALDYPRDKLQIQVLDDSTDSTREIARRAVEAWRAEGVDIEHVTRLSRVGYKAGALQHGLATAWGEFLAVFDADFLPPRDFLKRTLPGFTDPKVGCVQARWGHVNPNYSWLTRAQAAAIDIHFGVEQEVRSRYGLLMNFNGAAGLWRRQCIDEAGGWQAETLTEDLDLSYRAQLAGWRFHFLNDLRVPSEIPVQLNAYKRQQFRWAKGSIQTARKLLGTLWQSPLPWYKKLFGTFHLTGYVVHPLMLIVLATMVPVNSRPLPLHLPPWIVIAAFGPWLLYWASRAAVNEPASYKLALLVTLILVGTGMALNSTKAILEALVGIKSGFERTPKFNIQQTGENWGQNQYALPREPLLWFEIAAMLYAIWMVALSVQRELWGLTPWLVIYAMGYGYFVWLSFYQSWEQQKAREPRQAEWLA
ncbi:MAG: glycosyltransferase family 2 protein [Anaerolineae bacterium]|nr:glycosyltransferase family 2 protein [Anaerolineae bacterium]